MDRVRTTGNAILDGAIVVWGWIVAAMQAVDLETLNEGAGFAVAILTTVLLGYRIYLAHEEVTTNEGET